MIGRLPTTQKCKGELDAGWAPLRGTQPRPARIEAPVPDGNYTVRERPGPPAMSTIDGRVRYRGSLADPNEPR